MISSANHINSSDNSQNIVLDNVRDDDGEQQQSDIQKDPKLTTLNFNQQQASSPSWNFILLSTLFIIMELIIYLYHEKIASYLLIATNCSASSVQSPEFSTISCLSPRRVIYGWSSNAQPQIILSILLYPVIFPNWVSLFIGLIILYLVRKSDSFTKPSIFLHLFQLYQIQFSTFIIRAVISFVRFRAFGWVESLLWAFDALHFVSCNSGGTSFVFYHLVKSFSETGGDEKKKGGLFKMILLVVGAFAFHFTSHLPLSYIPLFVSPNFSNSIPSNYLIDHISACILTIVFSE